jgi:hypothetical protein
MNECGDMTVLQVRSFHPHFTDIRFDRLSSLTELQLNPSQASLALSINLPLPTLLHRLLLCDVLVEFSWHVCSSRTVEGILNLQNC